MGKCQTIGWLQLERGMQDDYYYKLGERNNFECRRGKKTHTEIKYEVDKRRE